MSSTRRNRAMTIAKRIRSLGSGGKFNLRSPGREICGCKGDFGEFVCCYRQAFSRNYQNFRKSRAPSRFLFYKDSQWNDYPDEILSVLKEGFVNGRAEVYLQAEGGCFIIDFLRMLEVDLGNGYHRSIAWIDAEGHCFFPELLSGESSAESGTSDLKMVTELRVHHEDDAVDMAASDVAQPSPRAELQSAPDGGRAKGGRADLDLVPQAVSSKKVLLLRLKENDRAHNTVKNVFLRGMRKLSSATFVTAVYRCPAGARLQVFKRIAERTEAARGHANIRYAWYGTAVDDVRNIVMHGFGQSNIYSGPQAFGVGINLSHASCSYLSASMAEPDVNGNHHVILCCVIMGNVEEVQFGSEQACPSCDEFDNGIDDAFNSKRYIIWSTNMNSHILPEYVVSFRSSPHPKGNATKPTEETSHDCATPLSYANGTNAASKSDNMRLVSGTAPHSAGKLNMSFQYLFAELEKSLPSFKSKALNFLYNGYKAGKISKDVLIRKVRLMVGDQLVLATIKNIRKQI